jgi:hypothetical protein
VDSGPSPATIRRRHHGPRWTSARTRQPSRCNAGYERGAERIRPPVDEARATAHGRPRRRVMNLWRTNSRIAPARTNDGRAVGGSEIRRVSPTRSCSRRAAKYEHASRNESSEPAGSGALAGARAYAVRACLVDVPENPRCRRLPRRPSCRGGEPRAVLDGVRDAARGDHLTHVGTGLRPDRRGGTRDTTSRGRVLTVAVSKTDGGIVPVARRSAPSARPPHASFLPPRRRVATLRVRVAQALADLRGFGSRASLRIVVSRRGRSSTGSPTCSSSRESAARPDASAVPPR